MKIKLWPDKDIRVKKIMVGRVPVLSLRPLRRSSIPVAVLWIHGGGYITGMKEMVYMSRAVDLVKKYGVTVFSPGYRLAWQKAYPAAVDDCYQVLEYMSRKCKTIFVGGESAGGGLAAAVCMMARDRGIRTPPAQCIFPRKSRKSSILKRGFLNTIEYQIRERRDIASMLSYERDSLELYDLLEEMPRPLYT